MSCKSCGTYCYSHYLCSQCFEKTQETLKVLLREKEDLKATVGFLRFLSPVDHRSRSRGGQCYTDVILVATSSKDCPSGSVVPVLAHKAVLVSRSPVFKAMLENEMKEKRSSIIKIRDVSYDALCAFVDYLYTAEACLEEKLAFDLLELAEKYEVEHLKTHCEKFLVSKLNWDNSVMNYVFAHQHNATYLLNAALSLITANMNNFITREEYAELVKNDPRLVVEIYEAYLSKQVKTAKPPS